MGRRHYLKLSGSPEIQFDILNRRNWNRTNLTLTKRPEYWNHQQHGKSRDSGENNDFVARLVLSLEPTTRIDRLERKTPQVQA